MQQGTKVRPVDTPGALWTLLLATSINEAMLLILPSFVGALTDELHLGETDIGLLASMDLLGIALVTATGPFWLRRAPWRALGIGALLLFLVLNLACLGVHSFRALVALRLMCGAVSGVGFAIGLAGVLEGKHADRNAGLLLVVQVIFSAIGMYVLDAVPPGWRLDSVYLFIAAWLVPCLLLALRYYPERPDARPAAGEFHWRRAVPRALALLLGAGAYFLMIGGVWGYLEGVARSAGLTLAQTGQALSVGLIVSLLGAGLAAGLGLRLGRAGPLLVSALVQAGSLYLLLRLGEFRSPVVAFFVINAAFQIAWSYVIPYFMVMFAELDPSGRFIALYGTVTHLTLAIGPYLGAFLISGGGLQALLRAGILLVAVCYGAFLCAAWLGARQRRGAAAAGPRAEAA